MEILCFIKTRLCKFNYGFLFLPSFTSPAQFTKSTLCFHLRFVYLLLTTFLCFFRNVASFNRQKYEINRKSSRSRSRSGKLAQPLSHRNHNPTANLTMISGATAVRLFWAVVRNRASASGDWHPLFSSIPTAIRTASHKFAAPLPPDKLTLTLSTNPNGFAWCRRRAREKKRLHVKAAAADSSVRSFRRRSGNSTKTPELRHCQLCHDLSRAYAG